MNSLGNIRFIELIKTYGSKPEHWPTEHRKAMQQWILRNAEHAELNESLTIEKILDAELDQYQLDTMVINDDYIEHQVSGILNKINHRPGSIIHRLQRPVLSAGFALSLLMGVTFGYYFQSPIETESVSTFATSYDYDFYAD